MTGKKLGGGRKYHIELDVWAGCLVWKEEEL